MKNYNKSLFIFRRDLRIFDNTALNAAIEHSEQVVPVFIFDPRQIEQNEYRSNHCLQFMLESLADLEQQLKDIGGRIYYFYGQAEDETARLIKENNIDAVFFNYDYTPYSKDRDSKIKDACKEQSVAFRPSHDLGLNKPGDIEKNDGGPYTVYSFYRKKAEKESVRKPETREFNNCYTAAVRGSIRNLATDLQPPTTEQLKVRGGRAQALPELDSLPTSEDYENLRNDLAKDATTHLSAHNKFGTVSVREIYHQINNGVEGRGHTLISELHWRDFFTQIAHFFPHVFGQPFNKKYAKVPWGYSNQKFDAWCAGRTGCPIVDAGMRELNETGYMHNRARMITASFLTKDLNVDWRWGEKYFATKLVDYDPAVNNGNWQWAASTGCDAQPYFRIFNPYTQQKRFDKAGAYVKRWVNELSEVESKHFYNEEYLQNNKLSEDYPQPIVDHSTARKETLERFKSYIN